MESVNEPGYDNYDSFRWSALHIKTYINHSKEQMKPNNLAKISVEALIRVPLIRNRNGFSNIRLRSCRNQNRFSNFGFREENYIKLLMKMVFGYAVPLIYSIK